MFVEDCDYGNYAMQSIMYIRLYILYIFLYLYLFDIASCCNKFQLFTLLYRHVLFFCTYHEFLLHIFIYFIYNFVNNHIY